MPFYMQDAPHEAFIVERLAALSIVNFEDRLFYICFWRAFYRSEVFDKLLGSSSWQGRATDFNPETSALMPLLKEHVRAGGALYAAGHRRIPQALDKNCCRVSAKCAAFLKRVVRFICVGKDVIAPCLRARESAEAIADAIQDVDGFGATHAKMLLATLSQAFPEEVSLSDHCPVGKGAKDPLKWMLGGGGGLAEFRRLFLSGLPECREGSFLMEKAEQLERAKGWLPDGRWSLLFLQVQLCEFRQFVKFCGKSGVSLEDFDFEVSQMFVVDVADAQEAASVVSGHGSSRSDSSGDLLGAPALVPAQQPVEQVVLAHAGAAAEEALLAARWRPAWARGSLSPPSSQPRTSRRRWPSGTFQQRSGESERPQ